MNLISAPQRTLHAFLLAYHRPGLDQAAVNALPLAASCDLQRLVELGMVQLRFVPIAGPQVVDDEAGSISGLQGRVVAVDELDSEPSADVGEDDATFAGLDLIQEPDRAEPIEAADMGRAVAAFAVAALGLPDPEPASEGSNDAPPGAGSAWTAERKRLFVDAIRAGRRLADANEAAGFSRAATGVYYIKKIDPEFARQWEAAADEARKAKSRDQEISRQALAHQEEQRRIAALLPPMSVEEAQLILQRKGRVVYRASVKGGPKDRWEVSGMGFQPTDAELIAEAERVEERGAK